jgi:DNA-directed RNA polymerase subunit RPC12/RpoP
VAASPAAAAVVVAAAAVAAAVSAKPRKNQRNGRGDPMIGGGRVVGLGLMVGSVILFLGFVIWVVTAFGSAETTSGGMALGIFLWLVVLTPIFGIGVYVFRKGSVEKEQFAYVEQEKKILNMVLTQGQVTIPQLVGELGQPRDEVQDMIRDLVGKQLFSGAINWEKGILYSVESQALTDGRKCPNCGGELRFAGKGLIVCPYCGSEVFLTQRAAAATAEQA